MKPRIFSILSTLSVLMWSLDALSPARCNASSNKDLRSGDAYIHLDDQAGTWVFGTSTLEEDLRLSNGSFTLTKLENRVTKREFISGPQGSEEFRITINKNVYSGATGHWQLVSSEANKLSQGEIKLVIRLKNDLVQVDKTYLLYPHTNIVRQWFTLRNLSAGSINVSDPYFLSERMELGSEKPPSLLYMTGGGYFTGSQVLKHVALTNDFARTFDSTDKVERTEVGGSTYGDAMPWGSGAYMQWFCVHDVSSQEGLYVGFDYYGRWAADIGNYFGNGGYIGLRVSGYSNELAPGGSMITPMAFTGVFTGDLDAMGNQLKDWQYEYLWDYTNSDYFAKIRYQTEMQWQVEKSDVDWGGGTQDNWDFRMATVLRTVDLMRYVGADILWQDAGWHDYLGDNDGPAFGDAKKYMDKYGLGLAVWWPLYTISNRSKIYHQHPEWLSDSDTFSGSNLDTSKNEVIDYLLSQLGQKVSEWGDFQWRLDGTSVVPVKKSETPMLAEYLNVMGLLATFRRSHPHSSIDICAGGGNLMGFETLHLSDVSQLTDGGSLNVGNYYSSYLFPPDKIDDWTRVANFTWENARSTLTMAPAWSSDRGLYGGEPGLLLDQGLENLRRTFDIYRYLVTQGVAGRWSHVFHPEVRGDDAIYYFERLNHEHSKGVIVLKHFIKGSVEVFPKGLQPNALYDVRFEIHKRVERRTGSDLVKNGITLVDPAPGELIYLGLPDHPGSGRDQIPPSDPSDVTKRVNTNVGVTGIELHWRPASDNNWLSFYQIYRDGQPIDKVSKATYYFDSSRGADNISANYEVRAVDGDGNASRLVQAKELPGGPEIYTAAGGYLAGPDYSYQGAHGWSYEEWVGPKHNAMIWNGALGHMGAYQGTGGSRKGEPTIGATWLAPGATTDAVRIFTLPHTGLVAITGSIQKDIYHTYGDGVQAKVLKNEQQIWPETGWEKIGAADTTGKAMVVTTPVNKGDKLFFVLNRVGDSTDDETVWDPKITYNKIDEKPAQDHFTVTDNSSSRLTYSEKGWQRLGLNPWSSDVDQGYLSGWVQGSISISAHPGSRMNLKFHGTGIDLLGDIGGDGGMASIILDGKNATTIDTFAPSHVPSSIWNLPSKRVGHWAAAPPVRLWGAQDLQKGEHTLEVVVTGNKNDDSIGTAIGIDAVIVTNGAVDESTEDPKHE